MATYQIYVIDTDGSERKAREVEAKSSGHAIANARRAGETKITEAVLVQKK